MNSLGLAHNLQVEARAPAMIDLGPRPLPYNKHIQTLVVEAHYKTSATNPAVPVLVVPAGACPSSRGGGTRRVEGRGGGGGVMRLISLKFSFTSIREFSIELISETIREKGGKEGCCVRKRGREE